MDGCFLFICFCSRSFLLLVFRKIPELVQFAPSNLRLRRYSVWCFFSSLSSKQSVFENTKRRNTTESHSNRNGKPNPDNSQHTKQIRCTNFYFFFFVCDLIRWPVLWSLSFICFISSTFSVAQNLFQQNQQKFDSFAVFVTLFCSDAYTNWSNNLCFLWLWIVILHSLAFDALCNIMSTEMEEKEKKRRRKLMRNA